MLNVKTGTAASSPRGDLSPGQKLAYGSGDLASNLVWGLMLSFLMYYYTDIYIIPAATVAWLLLWPRVLDALLDPLFGYVIDRSSGRHVKRLIGMMAVPFGLAAFFCFLPLPLSSGGKIIWACGTYLVLGAVYSAINTPYGVLGNMMATTPVERVSLNAYRMAGGQLGQLIAAGATLPAIAWLSGGTDPAAQRSGVVLVAGAIGCAGAILWLATWWGCRVRRDLPQIRHSLPMLVGALAGNRRWHVCNALTFLNFTVFCSESGLIFHYTRLILGHPASDGALVLMSALVAAILGIMLLPRVTARIGNRRTYLALLLAQAACLLILPATGSSFSAFLVVMTVHYTMVGPISPLCYAMLSGAVDESRERTGIAAAGMAYSINTFVSKVAAGIAGFLVATFLDMGHYQPTMAHADATLAGWIRAGFIGVPLAAVSIAFLIVLRSRPDAPLPVSSQQPADA